MIDKVSSVSSEEPIFLDKARSRLLNTSVCPMFTHKPLCWRIWGVMKKWWLYPISPGIFDSIANHSKEEQVQKTQLAICDEKHMHIGAKL